MKLKNILLAVGILSPAVCFAPRGGVVYNTPVQAPVVRQQRPVMMETVAAPQTYAQEVQADREEEMQAEEPTMSSEEQGTQGMSAWKKAGLAAAGTAAVGTAAYLADQRYNQGKVTTATSDLAARGYQGAKNLAGRVYPRQQPTATAVEPVVVSGPVTEQGVAPMVTTEGAMEMQPAVATATTGGVLSGLGAYGTRARESIGGAYQSAADFASRGYQAAADYAGQVYQYAALKGTEIRKFIVDKPGTAAGIAAGVVAFGVAATYAHSYLKDAYAGKFFKDNKTNNDKLVADMQKSVKSAQTSFDTFTRKYSPVVYELDKAMSRRAILLEKIVNKLQATGLSSKEKALYQRLYNALYNDNTFKSLVARHEAVERMLTQFNADLIVIQKSFNTFTDNMNQMTSDFNSKGKTEMDNSTASLSSMLDRAEQEFEGLA